MLARALLRIAPLHAALIVAARRFPPAPDLTCDSGVVTTARFNDIVAMSETLVVNEVYLSVQGESTFAGLPCVFVRLTACNLRCSYCDTAYAFTEGKKRELSEVRAEVLRFAKPFAERGSLSRSAPVAIENAAGWVTQPASLL